MRVFTVDSCLEFKIIDSYSLRVVRKPGSQWFKTDTLLESFPTSFHPKEILSRALTLNKQKKRPETKTIQQQTEAVLLWLVTAGGWHSDAAEWTDHPNSVLPTPALVWPLPRCCRTQSGNTSFLHGRIQQLFEQFK